VKNRIRIQRPIHSSRLFLAILTLFACVACTVRFVSEYDDVVDHSTTELQKRVETFVRNMETEAGTPEGEYENNKKVYDELLADVNAIKVRASAATKNDITVEQIELVGKNIEDLKKLHVHGGNTGLRASVADPALVLLNVEFTAIIKFELAKKRGK